MAVSNRRLAALVSGGPDSAVLVHHLADAAAAVHPLFVRQGLRWEETELAWLRRFLAATPRPNVAPLAVVSLPLDDLYPEDHFSRAGVVPLADTPDEDVYLPGRNLTLLAKAGVFAAVRGLDAIALGPLAGNPFPDATPAFLAAMERALSAGLDRPLRVLAPLAAFRKEEVLLLGRDLPLGLTFSCLDPAGDRHCGRCSKCRERRDGFCAARLADPTDYAAGF